MADWGDVPETRWGRGGASGRGRDAGIAPLSKYQERKEHV